MLQWIDLAQLRGSDFLSPAVGIVSLVVETPARSEACARQLIQETRQQVQDASLLNRLLELIETVLAYKYPEKTQLEIETMFDLEHMKQTRYWQDAQEQEAISLVTRQLRRQLGTVSREQLEQLKEFSKEQVELLGEDLLDFSSMRDLEQWLDQHSRQQS